MAVREARAAGREALALATELLQRARLADPDAGLWEAADLQWWSRAPRRSDAIEQRFWVDGAGPVAAVVLTDWGEAWQCDLLAVPDGRVPLETLWGRALEALDAVRAETVEVLARDDDAELLALLAASGFVAGEGRGGICWLGADDRPGVAAPPDGFAVVDRAQAAAKPHPLIRRNGEEVEARLRRCSLYDPGLDLTAETQDGERAGYALFWADPVTGVGLVEPMRVEDAYQRRGLGRALLTEGLDRLARRGARRLKVGYGNDAGLALYTGAGFRVTATNTTYRRTAVLYS